MALLRVTSPHLVQQSTTGQVMLLVVLATLPGLAVLTHFFGWGSLIQVIWAALVALVCEALVLKLRGRPVSFYLSDYSALVTAVLIGLALPPLAPWWLTLIATAFAIIVAKQLYGGLGQNPFNPAMVGYALVLIAFPVEMTSWVAPKTLTLEREQFDFLAALGEIFPFLGSLLGIETIDAFTMATPLDEFKHKGAQLSSEIWQTAPALSPAGWTAWQYTSIAYLLGGLYLLYRRIYTWHTPVAMLASLFVMSFLFWITDPSNHASPELHLLGGATMLCAFFIATDPVTCATSNKGKLIYGAGIGVLVYAIRTWGGYPDAVAFAVLLMNFAAPLIDYYSQPRTYGHQSGRKG